MQYTRGVWEQLVDSAAGILIMVAAAWMLDRVQKVADLFAGPAAELETRPKPATRNPPVLHYMAARPCGWHVPSRSQYHTIRFAVAAARDIVTFPETPKHSAARETMNAKTLGSQSEDAGV